MYRSLQFCSRKISILTTRVDSKNLYYSLLSLTQFVQPLLPMLSSREDLVFTLKFFSSGN